VNTLRLAAFFVYESNVSLARGWAARNRSVWAKSPLMFSALAILFIDHWDFVPRMT